MKEFRDGEGRPVDWRMVRAAIFDMDGTLYRQRPVRIRMAVRLGNYYLLHPGSVRELAGIWYFRKIREQAAFRTRSMAEQIRAAAQKAGLTETEGLEKAIRKWMFHEPLALIPDHGNEPVLALIRTLREEGKTVIIYSDYPPEEKLKALGVVPDAVYYPGLGGITEMKPSGENVRKILKDLKLKAEETVYLGDRDEKDGKSARDAGVRFLPVKP